MQLYTKTFCNFLQKGLAKNIYYQFNTDKPIDYPGYSLSISHVIAIHSKSKNIYETEFYYVDRVGFKKIKGFGEKIFEKYKSILGACFTGFPLSPKEINIIAEVYNGDTDKIKETLKNAFDISDILDNVPDDDINVRLTGIAKGVILTMLSARIPDGNEYESLGELLNADYKNSEYGSLKLAFKQIKAFSANIPMANIILKDTYIDTIYGRFILSDIDVFDDFSKFNLPKQDDVDWYVVSKNCGSKGLMVFNDYDIVDCGINIDGHLCKRNTSLVNPKYKEVLECLYPSVFSNTTGKTYRVTKIYEKEYFDVTLYHDDNDKYRFLIINSDGFQLAAGMLDSIIDNVCFNDLFDRNTIVKIIDALDLVKSKDGLDFVCYDLFDRSLTKEYIENINSYSSMELYSRKENNLKR